MPSNKPTKETLENWQSDPSNWKWGIFYFNKNDKRIFPPKKIPALGWTINFANPISIIALVIICVLVIVLMMYMQQLYK